jgi:transcriptional regulator of met regulon
MANREVLQRASPRHWVRRNLRLSQRWANATAATAACSLRLIFLIPLIALSTSINEQQQQQLNNCRGITAPLLLCQLFIVALVLL